MPINIINKTTENITQQQKSQNSINIENKLLNITSSHNVLREFSTTATVAEKLFLLKKITLMLVRYSNNNIKKTPTSNESTNNVKIKKNK